MLSDPSRRLRPAALAALWLAAVVSHLPALANGLALDDATILANPAIQSLRTLPAALASPWWYATNQLYRPLTLVTFALERAVAGSSPVLPHATNLALHGLVAVLLVRLLVRFLPPMAALTGALLFAVLPGHAEAVASIVGRAELLSALAMVTLLLLVTGESPPSRRDRMLACLLAAAALASKEGGVVAPLLAFAAAWARPAQRPHAFRWGASAAVGTLVMLIARLAVLGTLGGDLANPIFRFIPAGHRILIALAVLPRAAAALVLPIRPPIDYVPSLAQLLHPDPALIALGLVLVVVVAVASAYHLYRPSAVGLGVWIVAATLAPTANLIFPSGIVLAGRNLYAPGVGAAFIVGALAAHLAASRMHFIPYLAFASVALAGATRSWHESAVWRSSDSVIAEMQRRHPVDYRSFLLLAYVARDRGRNAEAVANFREAIVRFAGDPEMLTDGATVALRQHDTVTARAWLTRAVAVNPRAARARTRLVALLLAQRDSAGARQLLAEGLGHEPSQRTWTLLLQALDSSGGTGPRIAAEAP